MYMCRWVCLLAIPVLTYMRVNVNIGTAYFGQLPSLCSFWRVVVVVSERLSCNVTDGGGVGWQGLYRAEKESFYICVGVIRLAIDRAACFMFC